MGGEEVFTVSLEAQRRLPPVSRLALFRLMVNQRAVVFDFSLLTIGHPRVNMTLYALFSGFLDGLSNLFAILSLWHSFYERLEVDAFIPDFECGQRRVFGH